jgi:hypothetical protein
MSLKKKLVAAKVKLDDIEVSGEDLIPPKLIITQPKAQTVAEVLKKLYVKHQGTLQAQHIVDEAKKGSSPLHDYFDWDVKTAANRYWLSQARSLVRSVKVTYLEDPNPQSPKRAVISMVRDDGSRTYGGILTALSTERIRMGMIAKELKIIEQSKDRLKSYGEMSALIPELTSVVAKGQEMLAKAAKANSKAKKAG